ncbi:MAG: hypothetical protein IT270_17440 [Saprospiraceae bacterium]|nr:hypothetical protein [Saprospiraceae bacterium]
MRILTSAVFLIFCLSHTIYAQCAVFDLQALQSILRTPVPEREAKITDLGFDYETDIKDGIDEVRQYHKCWQSASGGHIIYEQVLQWNFGLNSIVFLTLDEQDYTALHESIVGRAEKTGGTDGGNTYSGRLYRYYFGIQQVNGVDYYMVSIRNK